MMRIVLIVVPLAAALFGCCTSVQEDRYDRIIGEEMWSDLQVCGIFSGFGASEQPDRSDAVYSPISPSEYADLLCAGVDLVDYSSCFNRVQAFYDDRFDPSIPDDGSTAGPFAMSVAGDLYFGSYRSTPFSASFVAKGDFDTCRGSYNAFAGDTKAVFDVQCDNGQRGEANIVLARSGRDGSGIIEMTDGRKGPILFGHTAVAGIEAVRR